MTQQQAGFGRRAVLPALFFLVWALVFSFPLALHMSDAVVLSRGGDAWLHLWDLWWVDKALVELHRNPYHTTYLLYPTGLNLYYHSLDLVNAIIGIPLQRLFGLTPAFNLLVVANLTLDGLAAYWLCLDRSRSIPASLVGGALFASAPLLGSSLDAGQLDELTVWWVPLYILALLRALESPGPVWRAGGGRRATLAAGVCLVGAALATWYFTAGLVIFTVVFVPAFLLANAAKGAAARKWTAAISKVALVAGLFVIVLSPLLYAMVRERLSGATYMLPSAFTTQFNSADLLALFLPTFLSTDLNGHGSIVALGYLALILSAIGIRAKWRMAWPVALALLVLVILAMGPVLQVNGQVTGVPLPYALLNNVPFIGASRQPLRFLATAAACLSLLSSFGVAWLDERIRGVNARTAATAGLLLLAALGLFVLPRQLTVTDSGPAFSFIRNSSEPGAVLEVPYGAWAAPALLHQTYHGRPIVGGYTSRHFPYPFGDAAPGVSQLVHNDPDPLTGPDILSPPPTQTALSSLDHYGVRFVVVHKADMQTGQYAGLQTVIDTLFTDKDKVYEDDSTIVYRVPPGEAGSEAAVSLGSGWYKAEQNPLHRWLGANVTDGNGYVWVGIPPGAEGRYNLDLTAYSYNSPRHLSVVLDGNVLAQKEIGTEFEDLHVDLGYLPAGDHALVLQVQEPPETPPGDSRKLSIGVTKLAFERQGK